MAILRVAVPYTGMILSTRESPDMRRHLLRVGMSQMSAGSHTDVGSYHREGANEQTNADLGGDKMKGQFTLMDHRPVNEIVADLMQEVRGGGWCVWGWWVVLAVTVAPARHTSSSISMDSLTKDPALSSNSIYISGNQSFSTTHKHPQGYVPSWCTACYRKGRTGEDFMKIARAGEIHNFCHPNSLLTLQEYLKDYGTEEERELGQQVRVFVGVRGG